MCFSAAASFLTAGLTGGVGLVTLSRMRDPREAPLAAMPLLFSLQQASEGLVWLSLSQPLAGLPSAAAGYLFLAIAEIVWPLYAPLAALLVEPRKAQRRMMGFAMALGAAVSAYLTWGLASGPLVIRTAQGHLFYSTGQPFSWTVSITYVAATTLPLLLSSRRAVQLLGLVVLAGSAASFLLYRTSFQSVWCYFAAAGSVVILVHFVQRRLPAQAHGSGAG